MPQEIAPRIAVDPRIRFGKPVIKGTRMSVELLIGRLAGGMTPEQVAEEYALAPEDVRDSGLIPLQQSKGDAGVDRRHPVSPPFCYHGG